MDASAAECCVCGRPGAQLPCLGCAAMSYCSEKHRAAHRDRLGHGEECSRMAAAVAARKELSAHPFPWAPATHTQPPCAWLAQLGLHLGTSPGTASAWLRECPQHGGPDSDVGPWGEAAPLLRQLWAGGERSASLSRDALLAALGPHWMGMPLSHSPCLLSRAPLTGGAAAAAPPLPSWEAYYRLRGLPLESPAALLLDATLALYSAVVRLQQLLQQQAAEGGEQQAQLQGQQRQGQQRQGQQAHAQPGQQQQQQWAHAGAVLPQPLVLCLLGPQRELDAWPLLLELGCLLPPGQRIEVHLIGPDVPTWAHSRHICVSAPAAGRCGRQGCSCGSAAPAAAVPVTGAAASLEAVPPTAGAWSGAGPGEQPGQHAGSQAGSQMGDGAGRPAGNHVGSGSQTLFFWRGEWHELAAELEAQHGAPHAVVAPNAGLAAYTSWVPTLQRLLRTMQRAGSSSSSSSSSSHLADAGSGRCNGGSSAGPQAASRITGSPRPLVCCFTDYNREAVHRACQLCSFLLAGSGGGSGNSPARVAASDAQNHDGGGGCGSGGRSGTAGGIGTDVCLESVQSPFPFRKPAAVLAPDHALPSASNGFALWLTASQP